MSHLALFVVMALAVASFVALVGYAVGVAMLGLSPQGGALVGAAFVTAMGALIARWAVRR